MLIVTLSDAVLALDAVTVKGIESEVEVPAGKLTLAVTSWALVPTIVL